MSLALGSRSCLSIEVGVTNVALLSQPNRPVQPPSEDSQRDCEVTHVSTADHTDVLEVCQQDNGGARGTSWHLRPERLDGVYSQPQH